MMPFFLGYFAVTTVLGGNTNAGLVVVTVMGRRCRARVQSLGAFDEKRCTKRATL